MVRGRGGRDGEREWRREERGMVRGKEGGRVRGREGRRDGEREGGRDGERRDGESEGGRDGEREGRRVVFLTGCSCSSLGVRVEEDVQEAIGRVRDNSSPEMW